MTETNYDLSMRSTPPEWVEAERYSPSAEAGAEGEGPPRREPVRAGQARGERISMFTTLVAGVAAALVGGVAWYLVELTGRSQSPWIAVGVGVLISLVIRVAAGGADGAIRAGVSFALYAATLFAVLWLLTRNELIDVYGSPPGPEVLERQVLNRRANDVVQVVAYLLGGLVTVVPALHLRRRSASY